MTSNNVLGYAQRLYRVAIDFATVSEIEEELGSARSLYARLLSDRWTVGELVTLCHILLSRAGCHCDYIALGQDMIGHGFEHYRHITAQLLAHVFTPEEA